MSIIQDPETGVWHDDADSETDLIAALKAAEASAEKAEAERDAARADLAEAVAVLRKLDVGEGWAAQLARDFLAKMEAKK